LPAVHLHRVALQDLADAKKQIASLEEEEKIDSISTDGADPVLLRSLRNLRKKHQQVLAQLNKSNSKVRKLERRS